MDDQEKPLTGLWRRNPETPEGKYLVMRRDGTIPEWPSMVFGAKDPAAPAGLRAYADGCTDFHMRGIQNRIDAFENFKRKYPERMKQPGITRGL